VIADHSARAGDGASVGKTFHRIEEGVLRGEVEAAGFKLIAEGDFWRHPEDPRDFSIQPPPNRLVDEFVLKFQKPMWVVLISATPLLRNPFETREAMPSALDVPSAFEADFDEMAHTADFYHS
jgi:hypothetical protein